MLTDNVGIFNSCHLVNPFAFYVPCFAYASASENFFVKLNELFGILCYKICVGISGVSPLSAESYIPVPYLAYRMDFVNYNSSRILFPCYKAFAGGNAESPKCSSSITDRKQHLHIGKCCFLLSLSFYCRYAQKT